jgi:osmoprotectant transport system permease protein
VTTATDTTAATGGGWFLSRVRAGSGAVGEWIGLIITPVMALILAVTMLLVWTNGTIDPTTHRIMQSAKVWKQIRGHLYLTAWSTVLVILIAVPLGIFLTRPRYKRFSGPVLTFASSGQAIPAYGLLALFYMWLGTGQLPAISALVLYAILPVLRNTIVGLEQVDQAVIEAGRGMGMSKAQALRRIELPLSVPVILAGVRTALVINVGMAALAVFIGGGGLGETILSGLKLQRDIATFEGAAIVAMLALAIDWVAAVAERFLRPKGT